MLPVQGMFAEVENVMVDDMGEHMRADEEVVDVNQGPEEDSHAASVDSDKLSEWLDEVSGPQRTAYLRE